MLAAPAVMYRILISNRYGALKSPARVQMLKQVSFVRLIPTDMTRRHSTQIQAVNIGRRDEPVYQFRIISDGRDD